MTPRVKIIVFCLLSLALIGLDSITKELARTHLRDQEPISYLYDSFRLEYAENTGAFLSLGSDMPDTLKFWLLSILPLAFLGGLCFYALRKAGELNTGSLIALSLIFAGGLGNIKDRILYDMHVTDFMIFGIMSLKTGIVNFADIYVTFGAIALLVFYREKKVLPEVPEQSS
ncbi:MAG: signal peptidase II [Bacteroidetes bacterium]|nr:MAG: signal peptidase II [Bacteroidota bacterium]